MGLAFLHLGFAAIIIESFGGADYWMPFYILLLVVLILPSLAPSSAVYWGYLRVLSYLSIVVLLFYCLATLQYTDGNQTRSSDTRFFQNGLRGFLHAVPPAASSLLGTEINVFISADVDEVRVI
jgi:hypothetical protein